MRVLLKEKNMEIDKYLISLKELVFEIDSFYAHVDGSKNETICEHINLCIKYLNKIIAVKQLESIIESFFQLVDIDDVDNKAKDMFIKLFINTIVFHDIGKINPGFQSKKMNNNSIKGITEEKNYLSKHSLLSAYIYLEYFLKEIKGLSKDNQKKLKKIIYFNAFVISRHHSKINDFKVDFIEQFDIDNQINEKFITWINQDLSKLFKNEFFLDLLKKKGKSNLYKELKSNDKNIVIGIYSYVRFLHSLLVACDYYATSEFKYQREINLVFSDFNKIISEYNNSKLINKIRNTSIENMMGINKLRTKIFLEAENNLFKNLEKNIFYLEAPTGSGKSNTALNLSLQLIANNKNINKIIYVYPFNTLVEQNVEIINNIFGEKIVLENVAVVNSTTPIKIKETENSLLYPEDKRYQEALLDRQFLNYPIILTTHVSLFNTMFGNNRDSSFGFHQLANSVIVLDEIQNYRIDLWNEIITFLKIYAKRLNLKIIIMSATLPNFELLTNDNTAASLIKNKDEYYQNPIFKDRVKLDYHLLEVDNIEDKLFEHVLEMNKLKKKIMIEFIVRKSANKFYQRLLKVNLDCDVLFICGYDSVIERKKIIDKVKKSSSLILVATQVVEAGVDIDMDIGYKDISKLDSEEQFMGRINRSCLNEGIVFFFNLDKASNIYRNDERLDKQLTLQTKEMKDLLETKKFERYYNNLLKIIKEKAQEHNDNNVNDFFKEKVACLNFKEVATRMELILDTRDRVTVYLGRKVTDIDGNIYDGNQIWNEYEALLFDEEMEYSKKAFELSLVKSKMNYFMYQVNRNSRFDYTKQIGDIYYIENGEAYVNVEDGKLNMSIFDSDKELFI